MKCDYDHFSVSCEAYCLSAKVSEQEIQHNLKVIIGSLGNDKTVPFLSTAHRVLKEALINLCQSVKNKDIDTCVKYAHKLRGSSNLYASQTLVNLLTEMVEHTDALLLNSERCKVLFCEFSLVLKNIELKINNSNSY